MHTSRGMALLLGMDDALLLARYAQTRDSEAFATLVARHAGLVYGVCTRVLRDRATAEDAAQDSFLALAQHAGSIRTSLSAWLHRVALHAALRYRRHQREAALEGDAPATEPAAAWRRLAPQLDAALAALPDEVRALVAERYLEGHSQEVIAARLGVSQATISRRLQAGVQQLRTRLAASMDDALFMAALPSALTSAPSHLLAQLDKIGLAGVGAPAAPAVGGLKLVLVAGAVAVAAAGVTGVALAGRREAPRAPAPQAVVGAVAPAAIPPAPAPAPPPAPVAAVDATLVTITVHHWPLDRVVTTLNDQLPLAHGVAVALLPSLDYPLVDAVADHEPLAAVLGRVATSCGWQAHPVGTAFVLDHPLPEPDTATRFVHIDEARVMWEGEVSSSVLPRIMAECGDGHLLPCGVLMAGIGDRRVLRAALQSLDSSFMQVAEQHKPADACQWQAEVFQALATMDASGWEEWMPSRTPLIILRDDPVAHAAVVGAWRRCQRQGWMITPAQLFVVAAVGVRELVPDLLALVRDPTTGLPGYDARGPLQRWTAQTLRAAAIRALGRLGGADAAAALREALQAHRDDPAAIPLIAALGECGTGADAALVREVPPAWSWYAGAVRDVALAQLAPEQLPALLAAPGPAQWGEGDAAIVFPLDQAAQHRVLVEGLQQGWWRRWAVWKGTGRLPPGALAAEIAAARAQHHVPELVLDALAAREGDDAALSRIVALAANTPEPLCDALALAVENVPQELLARLSAPRQAAALQQLRTSVRWDQAGAAALAMLGVEGAPARVAEWTALWKQHPPLRPALLHALCALRQPAADAVVVAQLTAAIARSTVATPDPVLAAFTFPDCASRSLRAALVPVLKSDAEGAVWLATAGLACFSDTAEAAGRALGEHVAAMTPALLARLLQQRPVDGSMPVLALLPILEACARHATAPSVRHDALDALWESVRGCAGAYRIAAAQVVVEACGDPDPAVASMARDVAKKVRAAVPNLADSFYEQQIQLEGAIDDWEDTRRFDHIAAAAAAAPPPPPPAAPRPRASGF